MAGERGGVTSVTRQEEDRVLVSLPMVGFPPGFKLRPGERVVVVNEPSGPAVRPLVRAEVVSGEQAQQERLEVQGTTLQAQAATVRGEDDAEEHVVWYVDPGSAEGPAQIIASRPRR